MAPTMDTYVLVRPLPRIGASTEDEVKELAERSNATIRDCHEHGEHIKWLHSYITDDVVVCVYKASGEDVLREHASRTGIPCGDILKVRHVVSPSTANEPTLSESQKMASAHLSGVQLPTPQREAMHTALPGSPS